MGQRPMWKRQSRFLGVTTTGKPFWTISGREGDDDDQNKNDGTGSGSGSGDDGSSDDGSSSDDGTGDGSSAPHGTTVSLKEFEDLKARMVAADKHRAAAEQKVKEFEDANKSELEKAQRDLKDAQETAKLLETRLQKTTIHNKFLASNKYTWHDPETAIALLDMDGVEIEDDGKVKGLEDAIEKLAKSKPFLIKEDGKDDKGGKNKNDGGKNGGRPSGSNPPANNSNGSRDTDREKLLKKYPQLAR